MRQLISQRGLLASSVMLLLIGCATPDATVNWDCQDKGKSGEYTCQPVGGVSGKVGEEPQPVEGALQPVAEEQQMADITEMASPREEGRYVLLDRDKSRWQKKLPQLSQDTNEYPVATATDKSSREPGARQAEAFVGDEIVTTDVPTLSATQDGLPVTRLSSFRSPVVRYILAPTADGEALVQRDGITVVAELDEEQKAKPEGVKLDKAVDDVIAVSEELPRSVSDSQQFTVQLGAFRSEQTMLDYAEERGLRHLRDLLGHRTQAAGKEWFVISWGRFSSVQQARAAWSEKQQQYPSVEHWVRSVHSINQSKGQANN